MSNASSLFNQKKLQAYIFFMIEVGQSCSWYSKGLR